LLSNKGEINVICEKRNIIEDITYYHETKALR